MWTDLILRSMIVMKLQHVQVTSGGKSLPFSGQLGLGWPKLPPASSWVLQGESLLWTPNIELIVVVHRIKERCRLNEMPMKNQVPRLKLNVLRALRLR